MCGTPSTNTESSSSNLAAAAGQPSLTGRDSTGNVANPVVGAAPASSTRPVAATPYIALGSEPERRQRRSGKSITHCAHRGYGAASRQFVEDASAWSAAEMANVEANRQEFV